MKILHLLIFVTVFLVFSGISLAYAQTTTHVIGKIPFSPETQNLMVRSCGKINDLGDVDPQVVQFVRQNNPNIEVSIDNAQELFWDTLYKKFISNVPEFKSLGGKNETISIQMGGFVATSCPPIQGGNATFQVNGNQLTYRIGFYSDAQAFYYKSINFIHTTQTPQYCCGPVVTVKLIDSPLIQFKSGIHPKDVVCANGLKLVIKAEDGSPACVKPQTAQILIEQGWANQVGFDSRNKSNEASSHLNQTVVIANDTYDTVNFQTVAGNTMSFDGVKFTYQGASPLNNNCYPNLANQTEARDFEMIPGNISDMHTHQCWPPTDYPQKITREGVLPTDLFSRYSISFFDNNQTIGVGWCQSDQCDLGKTIYLVKRGWNVPVVYDEPGSMLEFYLGTNASIISGGQALGIDMSTSNELPKSVLIPAEYNYSFKGAGLGPCVYGPFDLAIFKGYYDMNNFTHGDKLSLYQPGIYSCPVSVAPQGYKFEPMSDNAVGRCGPFLYCSSWGKIQFHTSFTGLWNGTSFHEFPSAVYTIIAGDEWGHLAIRHFTVATSSATETTNHQPIAVQTEDIRGTINYVMTNTQLTEIASSSTGVQIARGGGLDTYDHGSIKLDLYHGKTSGSQMVAATVENVGKRTVHVYGINISGSIPIANSTLGLVVLTDEPVIVPQENAILEPGESQTKYLVGNWTAMGKLVTGFSAGIFYSYDDLQNYNGMTNGYAMSVPVQWIQ